MAIGKAYEAHFKPAAKEAQLGGLKQNQDTASANRHERTAPIKTSKKAAEAVGMSERTLLEMPP